MVERLQQRADGHIQVQCHVTALRHATNVWTRFLNQHPFLASTVVFGAPVILIVAFVLKMIF